MGYKPVNIEYHNMCLYVGRSFSPDFVNKYWFSNNNTEVFYVSRYVILREKVYITRPLTYFNV